MRTREPVRDDVPPSFEEDWRARFVEFAEANDDDAGIAGWSRSGLNTRFRFFRRRWREPAGPRYLDVGCGAGTYSRWLAEQGLDLVGIDYSHATLVKARQRTTPAILLCAANATRLPFADARFDGAVCFGLLQAVPESGPTVTELARVIRPGGELWIDALNRSGLAARMDIARRRLSGRRMHLRYESSRALAAKLSEAGFEVIARHWLPIVPSRVQRLQPWLETRAAVTLLHSLPGAGALLGHSVMFHARRRTA